MRRWSGLLRAALLLFVAGRCLVPMDETDLFFNLRLGEQVLATRTVATTNQLSFTYPDAPDPNLAWLFQLLLVLVHRIGSTPATVLLKTGFVVLTWSLLFTVALRRRAHPALAAGVLALAAWAAEPRFVERPHLVTFLGLAALLRLLETAEHGRPRLLWLLVPASVVWANANSCFFLAPATLLLTALGAWLDGAPVHARRLVAAGSGMAPFVLATPAHLDALRYIGNHFRMPSLRPLQEYRPAMWPLDGPFFLLAGLLLAVLSIVAYRRWTGRAGVGAAGASDDTPAFGMRHVLPALALGALGATRIRFVAEHAIFAGPAIATGLTVVLGNRMRGRAQPALGVAVLAALLLLTIVPRVADAAAKRPVLSLDVEADLIPEAAIGFLERHGLTERLYNDMEVGSYLTWRWGPQRKVFQDPRINGYPDEFHAVLRRADLGRPRWQAFMESFGVRAALLSYPDVNPRAAWWDPERWALVYRATDGLVFVRRDIGAPGLLAEELPLTFHADGQGGIAAVPLEEPPSASVVPACRWALRLGRHLLAEGQGAAARAAHARAIARPGCLTSDEEVTGRRELAAAALHDQDFRAALSALEPLADARAQLDRGFAHLGLGDPRAALVALESAREQEPGLPGVHLGRAMAFEALGQIPQAVAAYRRYLEMDERGPGATRARTRLAQLASQR